MPQTDALESAIRQELARVGTCTFQELREKLPDYYNISEDQNFSVAYIS